MNNIYAYFLNKNNDILENIYTLISVFTLKHTKPKYQIVLFYHYDISPEYKRIYQLYFNQMIKIQIDRKLQIIKQNSGTFYKKYLFEMYYKTKHDVNVLQLFAMTKYNKIIYVNHKNMFLRNVDYLFEGENKYEFKCHFHSCYKLYNNLNMTKVLDTLHYESIEQMMYDCLIFNYLYVIMPNRQIYDDLLLHLQKSTKAIDKLHSNVFSNDAIYTSRQFITCFKYVDIMMAQVILYFSASNIPIINIGIENAYGSRYLYYNVQDNFIKLDKFIMPNLFLFLSGINDLFTDGEPLLWYNLLTIFMKENKQRLESTEIYKNMLTISNRFKENYGDTKYCVICYSYNRNMLESNGYSHSDHNLFDENYNIICPYLKDHINDVNDKYLI